MKRLSFLFAALLMITVVCAQQPQTAVIKFDQESHNFGTVAEEAGSVSHEFTFTNTGTVPLVITGVRTSCGCTTPNWTKEPVAPGSKGVIKATYSTKGRPGAFSKTITVTSNADGGDKVLYIKGTVTEKGQSPDFNYPIKIGDLRLTGNNLLFALKLGEQKSQTIDMLNDSSSSMSLKFDKVPKYITITPAQATLEPGKKGTFTVTYDTTKLKKENNYKSQFFVLVNNETKPSVDNKIVVSGIVTK